MAATPDPRWELGAVLLGRRLRSLRAAHELTLQQTADRTGLALSYLSDIERGTRVPSLQALLAITHAYDVTVVDALTGVYPLGTMDPPHSQGH